ncbi:uncharacterized protein LOC111203791 [Brassica napus]|uniref:uncharacterized protein LOC111203791 n=1 Tax=Brassica napus TaxID=3708 RepID=UPI00207885A4|nr:uncharacterized protein LOC111203791 [Brassica napus]
MVNFWSSAFILPAGCYDTIESMCSAFLWSGSPTQTHKAKVSWEDLCFPKDEGGLGVRKFKDTARAFALKLIWRLFTKPTSLWVSWVTHYLLRYNSFWDVRGEQNGSWIWRKLLKLRDLAYGFTRVHIRDGRTTSFWFDNWLGIGKLINITGTVGTTYVGISRHAKVSDAARGNTWNIRGRGSQRYGNIYGQILAADPPSSGTGRDRVQWNGSMGRMITGQPFRQQGLGINYEKGEVTWIGVKWFAAFVEREMKQEITCSSPAHILTRFGNLWQDHLSDGTSTQIGNGQSIGYVLWEGKHWTQYSQGCYSKQPCTTGLEGKIQGVTSNERYRGIN